MNFSSHARLALQHGALRLARTLGRLGRLARTARGTVLLCSMGPGRFLSEVSRSVRLHAVEAGRYSTCVHCTVLDLVRTCRLYLLYMSELRKCTVRSKRVSAIGYDLIEDPS